METLVNALPKYGLPKCDLNDMPDSPLRFPDGGHYRMEVSGLEDLESLKALVDEKNKRGIAIHRIICFVGGTGLIDKAELRDFAQLARQEKLETIVVAGHSRGWDTGRTLITSEGALCGIRCRGMDGVANVLRDIQRCLDAGFRGFLCVDEGMLWLLNEMRKAGDLPANTVLKVSVFTGHANPTGAKVLEMLGANTFNPLADLSIPMLASIRQACRIPLDIYAYVVDSMGGMCRFFEAAEIARVAAPVYFKIEPGASEYGIYKPWVEPSFHAFFNRRKVKFAEIIHEMIEARNPTIKMSPPGSPDLCLPEC